MNRQLKTKPQSFEYEGQTRRKGEPWSVQRIDLRSPLKVTGEQFARVELAHCDRGKLTEIGRGLGAFDAMFEAVSNALDVEASLKELTINFRARDENENRASPECRVSLSVVREGELVTIDRSGLQLLPTCLEAYVDALTVSPD